MKKLLPFFAAIIIILGFSEGALAQCENITITGQGIDITQPLVCAPVEIKLASWYTFGFPVDPSLIQIRVYWNDGATPAQTFPAIETAPGSNTFKIEQSKIYNPGPACSYQPETFLIYNNNLCTSTRQAQRFSAWSTDDTNPGPVVMDPVVAEFCPSSPISNFVFHDNTTFNCNIAIEPDKPNRLARWVQFVYNTNPTPGNLVRNLNVNGTLLTDAAGNYIQGLAGAIVNLPAPIDGPTQVTLPISAPAGSNVGSYFEVTLRNWNICNPYDDPNIPGPPADPVNGDNPPKITTARILIVAPPDPEITTKNKNNVISESFCPNDRVNFEGKDNEGLGSLDYRWTIYNDELGTEANKIKESSNKNFAFTEGFPTAGKKLIKLRVRRRGTIQQCWSEVTKIVEVFNSPVVTSKIDEVVRDEMDICFDELTGSHTVKYSHDISSNNNFRYQYRLFTRNSTATSPNVTPFETAVDVNAGSTTAEYTATYTQPGRYRIWLVATDKITGCETIIENITTVYAKPVVAFSAPELCEGQPTNFKNESKLDIKINGDNITGYEWDFGDGSPLSTQKDPSHTYADGGTYNVSLTVKTKGNCEVTLAKDIVVNKVPEAKLSADYTIPICPGDVEFENLSRAINSMEFGGDDKVTYKIIWSDGSVTREGNFEGEKRFVNFNNLTNAEITYQVWLKAKAVDSDCELLSDPIEIKVKPGAKADFKELNNYSIFDDNCAVIQLSFEVDQATLDIAGEKHTWVIFKGEDKVLEEDYIDGHPKYKNLVFPAQNAGPAAVIYTVRLLVEKAGKCVQAAEHKYRINPRPVVEFDADVSTDCDFTFVHVKVKNMTGVKQQMDWQISPDPINKLEITYDDDFILIYERPHINDPNAVDVILSLNQENYFNCTQETPTIKVVKNNPKVIEEVKLQLTTVQIEGCSPLDVDFKNITDQAPAETIYELYIKHGIVETKVDLTSPEFNGDIKGDFTYKFAEPGLYTVSLKATVEGSCELFSPSSVGLLVNPFPKPEFELINPVRCSSFTTNIVNNTTGSAINHWSIFDLTDNILVDLSADNSGKFTTTTVADIESYVFSATGTVKEYEVRLVAESAKGCSADEMARKVTVYPAAEASFTIDVNSFCAPYEVSVTNTSLLNNPAGTSYSWSWGNGTHTPSDEEELSYTYTGTVSAPLPRDITLTVTTPDGCVATHKETIILQPKVTAAFTPNVTEGCSPLPLYLYNNSLGDVDDFLWEITEKDNGVLKFTSTSKSPNDELPEYFENTGSTNKVYVVSLRARNSTSGCESTQSMEITILPGVKAEFGMDVLADDCSETEVKFTNLNIQPGIQYTWNFGNGEPNVVTTTEEDAGTQFFHNNSTTRIKDYEITLTAYNPVSKCSNKSSQIIRVNPSMKVNVAPDKEEGCAPLDVTFSNRSENIQDHEWYYRLKGTNDREDVRTTKEVLYYLPNTTTEMLEYEVVYKATSPTGCSSTTVHTIKVYPDVEPQFSTDYSELTQPNATFQITNETREVSDWIYHWDFGDGNTSSEFNPGSHTYATYGVYRIKLTVSNALCRKEFFRDVTIFETMPIVDFESIPVEGCWPLIVQFENKSQFVDENTFKWNFGDGEGTATSKHPTYTYHKPGQYTVTLTAQNSSGQSVTTQHSIVNVYEKPRISFELRETEVFVPGDPLYVANFTVGASYYLWDFGDGTTYEEFEPVHYYKEPGEYTITLIAHNQWGCADTLVKEDVVTAIAGGKVKIPNAFTPSLGGPVGGDISGGNNDVFFPILDGGISKYNLKIYNRWGELLFESNRREIGWDGYYKGVLCKSDVYVFKLSVEFSDGKSMDKLGDVTLIR